MTSKQVTKRTTPDAKGSALILTVVLTTLLGVVAVLFVLLARMDRLGARASLRAKELDMAVGSVLERISYELVMNMPGMDPNSVYYDAPDSNNPWLASLEPYEDEQGDYRWAQISSLQGAQDDYRDVLLETPDCYINEYQESIAAGDLADADGDGIADSRWFEVPGLRDDQGQSVYTAMRIIDHGAMLNINTGYDFNELRFDLEARQMQVDVSYLSRRTDPNWTSEPNGIDALNEFRGDAGDYSDYLTGVVNRYDLPGSSYRPFDITDELKLRYRFVLDDLGGDGITTRIGDLWSNTFKGGPSTPISRIGNTEYSFPKWCEITTYQKDPDAGRKDYDYRHIVTTFNSDRLTARRGELQADLNQASAQDIYNRMIQATEPNDPELWVRLAQLAVNVYDFLHPEGDEPSQVDPGTGDGNVYGFMPQPFISEIVCRVDADDPNNNFFAVELYNPFDYSVDANGWSLQLVYDNASGDANDANNVIPLVDLGSMTAHQRRVIANRDVTDAVVDAHNEALVLAMFNEAQQLDYGCTIVLRRDLGNGQYLVLDTQEVFDAWLTGAEGPVMNVGSMVALYRYDGMLGQGANATTSPLYSVAYVPRSADPTECGTVLNGNSLGAANSSETYYEIQGNVPWNLPRRSDYDQQGRGNLALRTPVDLLRIPVVGPSSSTADKTLGQWLSDPDTQESDLFVDLLDHDYALRHLFQGVTVYDTSSESRVKGRINVNTAPEFVLQRLPWLDVKLEKENGEILDTNGVAADIIEGRQDAAYESIGDLLFVNKFLLFGEDETNNYRKALSLVDPNDPNDVSKAEDDTSAYYQPDETWDESIDDFEEEQLLLSLVSNQVTVRSDVFTAYVLVRLGEKGPQRRVMAILDRSGVQDKVDPVEVLAQVSVGDPRQDLD